MARSKLGLHVLRDNIKLSKEDLVIDCGAHTGEIIKMVAPSECQIIAFEPYPPAFEILQKKFSNYPNVQLIKKAVWTQDSVQPLFIKEVRNRISDGCSLRMDKSVVSKDKYIEVETVDLSTFIKNLNRKITVLKLDIEGSEYEVLSDLINTEVIHECDWVLAELHVKRMPKIKEKGIHETLKDRVAKLNNPRIILDQDP